MSLNSTHILIIKLIIHFIHWFALLWLFFAVLNGHLGTDPVEEIIHYTGKAGLNSLFATMFVTPFVRKFRVGQLIKIRRLLGIFTFIWSSLHLISYVSLDLVYQWLLVLSEIITRPYLVLGVISWIIFFILTVTSTKSAQKKLKKKWQALHNWVYVAVLTIPIHYLWSVKSLDIEPVLYLVCSFLLLLFRKDKFTRWFVK